MSLVLVHVELIQQAAPDQPQHPIDGPGAFRKANHPAGSLVMAASIPQAVCDLAQDFAGVRS